MTTDHPLISRGELEDMAAELVKPASRIGERLMKLADYDTSEAISELSPEDQQAFKCVTMVTERILADVKFQFKGKQKLKKKAT
jgi:hypothetical protein